MNIISNSSLDPQLHQQGLLHQPQLIHEHSNNIKDEPHEITKLFVKEYIVVWYDVNIESEENLLNVQRLKGICDVEKFSDFTKAASFIKSTSAYCIVISSGNNGQALTEQVFSRPNVYAIYIFCRNIDFHRKWAEDYPKISLVADQMYDILHHIAKTVVQGQCIVWYDQNIDSKDNIEKIRLLKGICDTRAFKGYNEATTFLRETTKFCQVITAGANGKIFVQGITAISNIFAIHVFCSNIPLHSEWAREYEKIVTVDNRISVIKEKIQKSLQRWQRENSSLKMQMPRFAFISNSNNESDSTYLHACLKNFINNRNQAKKDLIDLSTTIYRDHTNFTEFLRDYNDYNMHNVFRWYTRNSFFFKTLTNCLQIGSSNAIQYCRLIINDLKAAIKEQYIIKSAYFGGILYKAATIPATEWKELEQHIGEEIEILGFLLATKDESLARSITENNPEQRVLTKIIVLPQFEPLLEEQGFAEIRGFSSFEEENEVAFNIQSRFTVLEAVCEKKESSINSYLTLLHGVKAIETYITRLKPVVELPSYEIAQTNCVYCQAQIRNKILLLDLNTRDSYACMSCIRTITDRTRKPYVCVSPSSEKIKDSGQTMSVEGKVLSFLDHFDIPFYGSKCIECSKTNIERQFKCLTSGCKKANKIWCLQCFNDVENECTDDRHLVIYEDHPYTFWPGEDQEEETDSEDNAPEEHNKGEANKNADVNSPKAKGKVDVQKGAFKENKDDKGKRENLEQSIRDKEQTRREDTQGTEERRNESQLTKVERKESEEELDNLEGDSDEENKNEEDKHERHEKEKERHQVLNERKESDDEQGDVEAKSEEDEEEKEKEKDQKEEIQSLILRKEDTNITEQRREESQATKVERKEAEEEQSDSEIGSDSDNDSDIDSEQGDLKEIK